MSRIAPKRILVGALAVMALGGGPAFSAGALIERVSTDRARYEPGRPVVVSVDIWNRTGASFAGTLRLSFRHLGRPAGDDLKRTTPLVLEGARQSLTLTWTPPSTDFRGYLVEAALLKFDGSVADAATTAVDVSGDWARFPRYGFLSRFDTGLDAARLVGQMKDFHLNGIQFYDWQWQHHRPYSPNVRWPDIANRWTDRATVKVFIDAAHGAGMMAMNYNLLNGAYDGYWKDGSGVQTAWGLFKDGEGSYDASRQDSHCCLPSSWATEKIYLFNPASKAWQDYLFGREKDVFSAFAFDGFHIDSLGGRGALWDWDRNPVNLIETFAPFVNAAKTALDKRVVFNSVGTYGQDQVASDANVDFVYSELWESPGSETYADVVNIADRSQARTDKAIVFAGYMNYDFAKTVPDGQTRPFREPSVRLANAVMAAAGASHIELGDGEGMLSSEYFPNQKLAMSPTLLEAMREHYDFLTAYQNLLRDGTRRASRRVEVSGVPTSTDGRAGAVWTLPRSRPGADIVHFINLENNTSVRWRDSAANCPEPDTFTSLAVKVYYDGSLPDPGAVWYASPDSDGGKSVLLPFTRGSDAIGRYVAFTLPQLHYWSMVWIEKARPIRESLLSEDFESAEPGTLPEDWKPVSGSWAVRQPAGHSREMQVEQGGGVLAYRPGFDTGDYVVEGNVHVTSTQGNAALLARVQADGAFYQVEIKGGTTWALYKHDGGNGWREIASGPFSYTADSYHSLKLACRRNRLTVEIDGVERGTFTDLDRPLYDGTVGLRSESREVRFDNIRARALEPTPERAASVAGGLVPASGDDLAGLDLDPADGRVGLDDALRSLRLALSPGA